MNVQFTRNMIIQHEGWRTRCYIDQRGVPTIGVGYNLFNRSTTADLAAVGAPSAADLRANRSQLTNQQVSTLLDIAFKRSVAAANVAASGFNVLPDTVQAVLTDMLYNLGPDRARGFVHFWACINAHNWPGAAAQLRASRWYTQVPNRVADLIKLLQTTPPTLQGEIPDGRN